MKKTLLFIGLAMCTSFAFAQTNNFNAQKTKLGDFSRMEVNTELTQKVDYKASIFAKEVGDTIRVWHFSRVDNTEDMPVVYGIAGRVTSSDIVEGVALPANAQSNECATFQYVGDSTTFFTSQFFLQNYMSFSTSIQGMFNRYMGNGYMLFHMGGLPTTSGRPHAYMQFAPVTRPADATMINISLYQLTRKYYNQYFIDYKVNGQWMTREINVDGVDAEINSYCSLNRNYAMPTELASQAQIEIRLRAYGAERGNGYGNFWGVDNVAILYGNPDSWTGYGQYFIDGAYGTMPRGMNVPLTWYSTVANTGTTTHSGVETVITHIRNNDTVDVASNANPNMAPCTDSIRYDMVIVNERGFLNPDDLTYPGWFGEGMSGAYGDENNSSAFGQHRSLPTTELGLNKVQVKMSANSGVNDMKWPAIPYRVVGNTYGIAGLNDGYRWGRDNGIITTDDSYGASYTLGFVQEGENFYVTDSGNFGTPGYLVTVRYNAPSNVPEGWVLRGIELIPSTWIGSQDMHEASFYPLCLHDEYDGSSVSFASVNTGAGSAVRIDGAVNNEMNTGYIVADENGAYNAINVFFPEQPELIPNTSYRIGYQMASSGKFAVAASRNSTYYETDSGTYFMPIDSIEEVAGYGRNFVANAYDVYAVDPIRSSLWGGYYDESFPMIRAIVGPRIDVARYDISVDCDEDAVTMVYFDDTVCQQDVNVAEGGTHSIYIYPNGIYNRLDKLFIDGQEVVSIVDDDVNGDENFYIDVEADSIEVDDIVVAYRDIWVYTFENIHGNHSIKATVVRGDWEVAVDPVAADVVMTLAPNPATSQVAMVMKGVSGMVNCSIIDMSGRVVYSNVLNAERTNTIDLSNVPAGAYFVRINNDSFVKVEKLIVR